MIKFLLGKPGGGKSLFATRMVLEEIRTTRRLIVTNLALRLPELNELIQKDQGYNYGPQHINERIVPLADDWLKGFFAFRYQRLPLRLEGKKGNEDVPDADLEHLSEAHRLLMDRGELVVGKCDYRQCFGDGGVFYVLDEAHIAFGARQWQQTGQAVLYYLSQHRKLADDVIVITQSAQLIDKQFRAVCQDFTTIRNLSKERYGFFRAPGVFVRRTYLHAPTGAPADKAIETRMFTLDIRGTAQVYDTAAGIGIHGAQADKGQTATGLPWWVFVFGGALAVWLFLRAAPTLFSAPFRGLIHKPMMQSSTPPASHPASASTMQTTFTMQPRYEINTNTLVTGYSRIGGKVLVCFSDGSVSPANNVTDFRGVPGVINVDGTLFRMANEESSKHNGRASNRSGN